jgi:hypothetical protein
MILRKLLKDCCPGITDRMSDRLYHKAQSVLSKLRDETRTLMNNAEWSRRHQSDTENDPVIDVSEVGEACQNYGRMSLYKFKQLNRDERAQWIDFNDRLLAVANQILRDTEVSVQVLHTLNEIMTLVIAPIENLSNDPAARIKIRTLRETYFRHARTIKTDGRIRLRYLRILNGSHNEEIFATWNTQLQKELSKTTKYSKIFDEFLDAAKNIIDEIIPHFVSAVSPEEADSQRHKCALLKSKRDILHNKFKTNADQAKSWKERSETAEKESRNVFATESSRRSEAYAKCAHLYKEFFDLVDKLYECMRVETQSHAKTSAAGG